VEELEVGVLAALAARVPPPAEPVELDEGVLDLLAISIAEGGRGLAGGHGLLARDKTIPEAVFRLPSRQLGRFLGMLFMCDGSIDKEHSPSFTSASEELTRQAQHLLLRFGIQSRVWQKVLTSNRREFSVWELTVYNRYRRKFLESIPLWGEKRRRLESLCSPGHSIGAPSFTNTPQPYSSGALAPKVREPALATRTRGEEVAARVGYCAASSFEHQRKISGRPFMPGLETEHERLYDAGSDIFWDRVVSIEPVGERPVYDLMVEPTRCFLAGDVIVHNSTTSIYFATVASERGENPIVLDADNERSALEWAATGELPFEVMKAQRDRLARQARGLEKEGRVVIVDTPPNDREALRAAASVADRVVVPVAPTGVDVNRLRATLELLMDVEAARGGMDTSILLTRWDKRKRLAREAEELLKGFPLLNARIRALTRYEDGFGMRPSYLDEYEQAWTEVLGG
jgi:chromosome partitioning protein